MITEKLQEKYKEYFTPQIIYRGRDYFDNEKVLNLFKDKESEKYIAKVEGSTFNKKYDIQIILDDPKSPKMSCTCPCIDNCKHEYATLVAIDNKKYSTIKLLPVPDEDNINIEQLIKDIPEEKLKEFLRKSFETTNNISEDKFKSAFHCYLPEKSKEYFFNKLYNNFQFNTVDLDEYLDLARASLENQKYKYTFTIASAIIDASQESNYKDDYDILLNNYPKIGMFIRISYRKGDDTLKNEIEQWIKKYENINNVYLEDMIISIK